jgi:hypothetical protein
MTAPLSQGAGKQHGGLPSIIFEIRTKVHTPAAPDTDVILVDVLQKFAGTKNS